MRKIFYILIGLIVFASCDHEVDNWPGVDNGAAVPNIKLAEGSSSYMDFDNIASAEIVYDLSYISKNHKVKEMNVALIYNNGVSIDTFLYSVETSFPTKLVVNAEKISSATDGKYNSGNIKPGDKISLFISEFILNNGTTITPASKYKVKTADSAEDIVIDNYVKEIKNSVFYSIDGSFYVTATPHGIISGEYSVSIGGEPVLEDQIVTWKADGPNLECSHLVGGIWMPHDYIKATLIDLGVGQGVKFISSPSWLMNAIPGIAFDISVDIATKVITVVYSDAWGNNIPIVFVPKE